MGSKREDGRWESSHGQVKSKCEGMGPIVLRYFHTLLSSVIWLSWVCFIFKNSQNLFNLLRIFLYVHLKDLTAGFACFSQFVTNHILLYIAAKLNFRGKKINVPFLQLHKSEGIRKNSMLLEFF